jgi:hypothetical protein
MKWTVIYRPDAADELAAIWINAADRQAIADAANSIDRQLGGNPLSAGESRDGDSRVLWESPLVVFFDVNQQDCSVIVWGIYSQR